MTFRASLCRGVSVLLLLLLLLPALSLADPIAPVSEDELSPAEGLDESWTNVLLIGTDTRNNVADAARSDTMMICSIHSETGEIRLSSLARDMWVTIPGLRGHHKLNAAHSYGGPNLLMKTINELLGMNLTQYISLNFYGMSELVDAIGGVQLDLTAGEVTFINRRAKEVYGSAAPTLLSPGAQMATLSGAQALSYARIRQLDSDFGRTARQRKLLGALLEKVRGFSLAEQLSLYARALTCISTNMDPAELIRLGTLVLGSDQPVSQLSLPARFSYDSSGGISKVLFDQADVIETLHAFIYGEAQP